MEPSAEAGGKAAQKPGRKGIRQARRPAEFQSGFAGASASPDNLQLPRERERRKKMRWLSVLSVSVALFVSLAHSTAAQKQSTTTIKGTATDPSGGAIASATVV